MQSSTVTRAIDCRSDNWDRICSLFRLVIEPGGLSQDQSTIWPSPAALLTHPRARRSERPGPYQTTIRSLHNQLFGQENALLRCQTYVSIALNSLSVQTDPPGFGSIFCSDARPAAAAPKTLTNKQQPGEKPCHLLPIRSRSLSTAPTFTQPPRRSASTLTTSAC